MSNADIGYGAKFRRLVDSVYEDIAEITSIGGPNMSRDAVDVTNNDSPDGWLEFIGGLRDGGDVSLEMNFTRDAYETLFTDFENDTNQNYEILLPDAENTSANFEGLITSLNLTAPKDDKMTASVTVKVSGKVNLNSGSGSS